MKTNAILDQSVDTKSPVAMRVRSCSDACFFYNEIYIENLRVLINSLVI